MLEPGRKFVQGNSKYRYGFNGKEKDNEVKGEGNQQDYGMRIYDPRIGKFLSVDPLTDKYPFYGSYNFAANTPVNAVDVDGMEVSPEKNQNQSEHSEAPEKMNGSALYVPNEKNEPLDPLSKFGKGILKAGLKVAGAITELLAAPHQSDRQSPEAKKQNFPLTGGDLSIKTNVANVFIAPANAITNISNSNNPEVWGENLFYLTPYVKPFIKPLLPGPLGVNAVKPNSIFLGGAKGELFSKQKILEGNHMPTIKGIKDAGLNIEYNQASAIQMLYKEHRSFLSTGSSAEAIAFRAQETALLKKGDYMGAFELNAQKLQMQYGVKYNDAINQAREHYKTHVVSFWLPSQ
jgi:RHS repeat-associated protein